jgi:hypothetical protein
MILSVYNNNQMIKLSELTLKIKKWNMLGHSLLPPLELVIVASKS